MIAGWYHVAGSRGVAPAWLQMSSTTACRIEGGSPVGTMMYPSASRALRLGSRTAGMGCALLQLPSPSFIPAAVEPPPQHPRTGPGSPGGARDRTACFGAQIVRAWPATARLPGWCGPQEAAFEQDRHEQLTVAVLVE